METVLIEQVYGVQSEYGFLCSRYPPRSLNLVYYWNPELETFTDLHNTEEKALKLSQSIKDSWVVSGTIKTTWGVPAE